LQERASLVQGQVPSFLAGQLPESPDSGKNKRELMQQVQEFITGWQQVSTGASWGPWIDVMLVSRTNAEQSAVTAVFPPAA
jgi:hypothetical protein